MLNDLLFGLYPYLAGAVLLLGSWIRFDRDQYTWKAGSTQMLSKKGTAMSNNLFHIGVIAILAGHFVGLLTPEAIYHHVITTEAKQMVAMGVGGFFGVLAFIGMTQLVIRRFTNDRVSASSSFSDNLVLLMLYAQLILGLISIAVSSQHMDGSEMVKLASWAQNIVILHPQVAAAAIADVNIIYKLHIFLGLTIVFIFPFTRLVHIISAPIWYLGRTYQIVRQK